MSRTGSEAERSIVESRWRIVEEVARGSARSIVGSLKRHEKPLYTWDNRCRIEVTFAKSSLKLISTMRFDERQVAVMSLYDPRLGTHNLMRQRPFWKAFARFFAESRSGLFTPALARDVLNDVGQPPPQWWADFDLLLSPKPSHGLRNCLS
jgi:hypothetical protein